MNQPQIDRNYRQTQLQTEYRTLIKEHYNGINLNSLLRLSRDTAGFKPHPLAHSVEDRVADFARKHGIWLEDRAEHYNTMTAYLHPLAEDAERLYYLGIYYVVLFYIDDIMGNEFRVNMSEAERQANDREMALLIDFILNGKIPSEASKLVHPVMEVLKGFHRLGTPEWVNYFLSFTRQHLEPAVQDLDSGSLGYVLSVDAYVDLRNHVSGMYPAILMMEFAANNYLPRQALAEAGLLDSVQRLEYLCAAIGGLVNDFFSFEKEVLEAESDFNLIPVMMQQLNIPLEIAIYQSAVFTNCLYDEYKELALATRQAVQGYEWADLVERHIDSMDACHQAVWVWQVETERYQRSSSIFAELSRSKLQ